jgi:hypothetical protein
MRYRTFLTKDHHASNVDSGFSTTGMDWRGVIGDPLRRIEIRDEAADCGSCAHAEERA